MNQTLNQIRAKPNFQLPLQRKVLQALLSFLLGAFAGFLAKYLDNVPTVGEIGTMLGVWVLIATLLAAWSLSPKAAALHVFLFFAAMLGAYYIYSMRLFGFFPRYYFLSWGTIALLSPAAACIAWYARGNGWIAAFCAALPLGLLVVEGYRFFYTGSIPQMFDVIAAIFLLGVLARKNVQRARIVLLTAMVFFIFSKLLILSLIFGGL